MREFVAEGASALHEVIHEIHRIRGDISDMKRISQASAQQVHGNNDFQAQMAVMQRNSAEMRAALDGVTNRLVNCNRYLRKWPVVKPEWHDMNRRFEELNQGNSGGGERLQEGITQ